MPGVECGLDSCLGDGDGLLLHGLVDGHLITGIHLVKLIDTAEPALLIPDHSSSSRETCSRGDLAAGVHSTGTEVRHNVKELRFGCAWVADHADIDITTELGAGAGGLGLSSEQHERNATFDLVIAVDGWEETVDDVVVNDLFLAQLLHTLPLIGAHLVPNVLHILHLVGVRAQLAPPSHIDTAGQEGHLVVQVPHTHTQTLQTPHTLGLLARVTVACLRLLSRGLL